MATELDDHIIALIRRYGRRGINEATVWTMLRAERPDLDVATCNQVVERLVADGRLYRNRRRTRTMLQVAQTPTGDHTQPVSDDLFSAWHHG